ncbi:MAG: hypothetical protein FJ288_08415 [Planctomycetes bacterium]|nr:hypothetical protein [Planctomycetota bacterium]
MRNLGLLLGIVAVLGFLAVGTVCAEEAKGAGRRPTMGEISKIEGKTLTIKTSSGEQTATVDDATEITTEKAAKVEELKVGDRVRITKGESRYFGEVSKIDGKTLTIKSRTGEEQTVTVDDATTIMASVKAKLEDLKVGQSVFATIVDGKAQRISVRAPGSGPPEGKKGGKRDAKKQ